MNEDQRKHIEKTFGKEGLKEVENLVDSHGVNRKIIETKNLKANTELALATLKSSKSEFWKNLLLVIIGAVLGYFPTFYQSSKNENKIIEVIELLNKQLLEKNEINSSFQTDVQQMRLELTLLKKELESIKLK